MPTFVRRPVLQCYLNGELIQNVLSARWSFGYDQRVSEATVVCATVPVSGATGRDPLGNPTGGTPQTANYYDDITIIAGYSPENLTQARFTGLLYQYDYSLWPRSVTLICKGRLQLVADYENSQGDGISLQDDPLLGGIQMAGMTDQEMVTTVLNTVGSAISSDTIGSGTIGLDFGSGFIDGTGAVLGRMIKPEDILTNDLASGGPTVWKQGEGGLAFIEELDRVCLGFRLYESSGSVLWRAQVFGRPNNASVWTFTEGIDILEGRITRTVIPTRNRVRVSGYDFGLGFGPVTWAQSVDLPNVQPIAQWHSLNVSSPMIERARETDPGTGLACDTIWGWQIQEVARELVKVQLTTPLDVIINPGDTISVLAPSRGGMSEPAWVMAVQGQVDEKGVWSQTIIGVAGGEAPAADTPPWDVR